MKGFVVAVLTTLYLCLLPFAQAQEEAPRFQCRAQLHHDKPTPDNKVTEDPKPAPENKASPDPMFFDISDRCFPSAPKAPCNYIFIDTTGSDRKKTKSFLQKYDVSPTRKLTGDMIVTRDSDPKSPIEVDMNVKMVEDAKDPKENKQVLIGSTVLFLPADTSTIHAIVYSGAGTEEYKSQAGNFENQSSFEVDCTVPDGKVAVHNPLHQHEILDKTQP